MIFTLFKFCFFIFRDIYNRTSVHPTLAILSSICIQCRNSRWHETPKKKEGSVGMMINPLEALKKGMLDSFLVHRVTCHTIGFLCLAETCSVLKMTRCKTMLQEVFKNSISRYHNTWNEASKDRIHNKPSRNRFMKSPINVKTHFFF